MREKQVIKMESGEISIYGGKKQEIKYDIAGNPFVRHYGRKYTLDNFLSCHNMVWNAGNPWKDRGFDGYTNDSFFSGLLIKFEDHDESARVYTYIA